MANAATLYLQGLLDAGGSVVIPPGNYLVDEPLWIRGPSAPTSLVSGYGVYILALTQFRILQTSNSDPPAIPLVVEGLTLVGASSQSGDKQDHCFFCNDCPDLLVKDCTFSGAWGDGAYIGTRVVLAEYRDCRSTGCFRSGLVGSAQTQIFRRCYGHGALSGLRFEWDNVNSPPVSCLLEDCVGIGDTSSSFTVAGLGTAGQLLPLGTVNRCVGELLVFGGITSAVVSEGRINEIRRAGNFTSAIRAKGTVYPLTVGTT